MGLYGVNRIVTWIFNRVVEGLLEPEKGRKTLGGNIHEVDIHQHEMGYWVLYINSEFYCSADSYLEVVQELTKLCERSGAR